MMQKLMVMSHSVDVESCCPCSFFPGYLINYKREGGDWEEYEVGPRSTSHVLQGLVCGSAYQVFITAFNKIGNGLPSDILTRHTKGNGELLN